MSTSIPISGLSNVSSITGSDFIPIVQSGSLTTFRTPITSILSLMSASGSASSSLVAISASYSKTSSFTQNAATASFAVTASFATTASYALVSSTASFALSAVSASFASFAYTSSLSLTSTTASFATNSKTASFLQYSGGNNGTASFAINAGTSISSSFAGTASIAIQTLSASYALSASNADTASYAKVAATAISVVGGGGFSYTPITPVLKSAPADSNWHTINVTANVPASAKTVYIFILAWAHNAQNYVYVSRDHSFFPSNPVLFYSSRLGSENGIPMNTNVFVPVNDSGGSPNIKTFDINMGNADQGTVLYINGYTS